jgi:acyl carrier protein
VAAARAEGAEPDPDPDQLVPSVTQHDRPNLASQFRSPADDLQSAIAGAWQDVLGIEPIGIEDDFFDMGGDSLMAARTTARLSELFPVEVPVSAMFQAPTVRALADLIRALLIEKLESLSDSEVADQAR